MSKKVDGDKSRYLTFHLGDELYGMDILNVHEIIAMMKTTPVPKTSKSVEGVMNLRGNIIPIVSFRTLFDMPTVERSMYTAIVIVKFDGASIGFIVDNVEEVISVDNEQISEPPKFEKSVKTSFLHKMVRYEKNVIMILDLLAIFANDDMSELNTV